MTATYAHGLGPRPLTADEGLRLLAKVTNAYAEVIEQLHEYDFEHPDIWATCSEHPEGDCGYRDLPGFYLAACVTECDVRDAKAFLAAWAEASANGGPNDG